MDPSSVSRGGYLKIAFVLGTRPEIIKMSPIIRVCHKQKIEFVIIHTNQHYSPELDRVFFAELKLPEPKYNLDVSCESKHGAMVAKMLTGIEKALLKERPDWVLVQGDTNTVLAGAIAAGKLGIKLGHVEAGLRSYDRSMPEELNRIVTDHLSNALFCPTPTSAKNVLREGIGKDRIFVTGNTIVDAVQQNLRLAKNSELPISLPDSYFLLTLHRPSNVDNRATLSSLILTLEQLSDKHKTPIVFPIHPRTALSLKHFNLTPNPQKIQIIKPVGYLEMLLLMENAQLILTDSGGIQEEACILQVPCVTLRNNTERPETVEVGANVVAGTTQKNILSAAKKMLTAPRAWPNSFGNGKTGQKIIKSLMPS